MKIETATPTTPTADAAKAGAMKGTKGTPGMRASTKARKEATPSAAGCAPSWPKRALSVEPLMPALITDASFMPSALSAFSTSAGHASSGLTPKPSVSESPRHKMRGLPVAGTGAAAANPAVGKMAEAVTRNAAARLERMTAFRGK